MVVEWNVALSNAANRTPRVLTFRSWNPRQSMTAS